MLKELQHFTLECKLINPEANNSDETVRADCADITFANLDPVNVAFVNGYPLAAADPLKPGSVGGKISFGATWDEWNETKFIVKCSKPTGLLGLWVWKKHFTRIEKHDL